MLRNWSITLCTLAWCIVAQWSDPTLATSTPLVSPLAPRTITVLKQHPGDALVQQHGLKVASIANLHYVHGPLSDGAVKELKHRNLIAYTESDQSIKVEAAVVTALAQDAPPSWGLDRIDQSSPPLDNRYTYPKSAGSGVNVYVLDSGVKVDHPDIRGRVVWGAAFGPGAQDGQVDDLGHGTFVAGLIAGEKYGVAKKANIISVKVYRKRGDQTVDDVLQGIRWILSHYQSSGNKKAVVNISSGSPYNQALNDAVEGLTRAGLVVVTSAGNSGEQNTPFDSCQHSPSSAKSVISVGATDRDDKIGSFSNTGACITLFAPGVNVQSIDPNVGVTASNSGTSFSTPYVTGVVALMLSELGPLSPAEVKSRLVNAASKGTVKGMSTGTPNLLLNNHVVPWQAPGKAADLNNTGNSSSGHAVSASSTVRTSVVTVWWAITVGVVLAIAHAY